MLMPSPDERISAIDALMHPWFYINGTNLHKLSFNFDEVEEMPLTDE